MDFHAARRMWELQAAADAAQTEQHHRASAPQPTIDPVVKPHSVPQRPHSALAPSPSPSPVLSSHPPMPRPPLPRSPPPLRVSRSKVVVNKVDTKSVGGDSDYSDVGDYAADNDFYVPGVNEGVDRGEPVISAVSGERVPQAARKSEEGKRRDEGREWQRRESDFSFEEGDAETECGDEEDEGGLVRQNSNFSRLSAQSWLTVDSAQEVEVEQGVTEEAVVEDNDGVVLEVQKSGARNVAMLPDRKFPVEDDHVPAALFGIDVDGTLMDTIASRPLHKLSVFECCALLQAGVAALKKKSFRRFGARRVWLSADCDQLAWTSKKDGVDEDHIKLHKVAKIKCIERKVSIDVTEGYRISLLFADSNEAGLCVRALSCLIPLQARIRAPAGVHPPDKEREDYTLTDDVFSGRPLREYMAVNSYVVLCSAKGQPHSIGNKLAFSRSDGSFCGLRYIPLKQAPLLLRSQEEIAVLKRLDHPHIVKYHECLLDNERGGNYIIFEYLARGSLMDASLLEGVKTFPEITARAVIRDIVAGLTYLHSLRIAHGDLRPDNILRAVDGAVKINPLGCITHDFTEVQNHAALVRARLGNASPAFLAPELCWLCEAPKAHTKSYAMDVWAIGVVLYFMLYGRVPFGGRSDAEIQQSICTGKLRFPRHPETSRKVRSLLKGVLGEKDPKMRIGLSELESHPWFSENERRTEGHIGGYREPTRLIVSPAEVDSAVQAAKVRVGTRRS